MSNFLSRFLVIKDGVGERIRAARTRLGLKQAAIADLGRVSRATQVSYEAGTTEPNTTYLRALQSSDMDVPFILFGRTSDEIDAIGSPERQIDWDRLRTAHEDVEFFCQRLAPTCPTKYRWQMVAELYYSDVKLGTSVVPSAEESNKNTRVFLSKIWSSYV